MEKRKTPVHDFAPSWLKINPYDKDFNSSINKKTDNQRSSSSGPGKLEDTFDLRPQYLKQRDSNNKEPNTSSSHSNQKPANQLTNSQLSTFDYDADRVAEEVFRNKGWPSNSTNSSNQNNSWSNNRRYNLKSKASINSVTSSDALGDSASTRRLTNNSRINDSVINLSNVTNIGREDVNKANTGYPHHHQNHNFHHSNTKGRLSNSVRDESPLLAGDFVGENNIKSKSNTKNGFVDSNKFKEEFPSLVDEKQVNIETSNGNNVWDNVANKVFRSGSSKVSLVSRHLGSSLYGDKGSLALNGEKSINGSSYFRALVPVVPRRKNVNSINGSSSGSKDSTTLVNSLSNLSLGSTTKILPVFSKPTNHSSVSHSSINHSSASHSSTSHSMAILVKKHPKMKSNMTDFIPSNLRSSSSDSRTDPNDEQRSIDPFDDDDRTNSSCLPESSDGEADNRKKDNLKGEDKIKSEDNDVHILSSSLEAEERLLREMGWKEEDEDENFYAPLTEDEVKEFKDLINKRKSLKRYMSPKIHQGRFKFQVNSNQLPLSQLNFLNTLATEDQNNDDTDTSSDDDDDDNNDGVINSR